MRFKVSALFLIRLKYLEQLLAVVSSESESVKVLVPQLCPALCKPLDVAHKTPLSMDFSRQDYWSG